VEAGTGFTLILRTYQKRLTMACGVCLVKMKKILGRVQAGSSPICQPAWCHPEPDCRRLGINANRIVFSLNRLCFTLLGQRLWRQNINSGIWSGWSLRCWRLRQYNVIGVMHIPRYPSLLTRKLPPSAPLCPPSLYP